MCFAAHFTSIKDTGAPRVLFLPSASTNFVDLKALQRHLLRWAPGSSFQTQTTQQLHCLIPHMYLIGTQTPEPPRPTEWDCQLPDVCGRARRTGPAEPSQELSVVTSALDPALGLHSKALSPR